MDNRNSNTQWFPGAHNISFVNANFTTIQGAVHKCSPGFALLSQHISHDAMFDSAARYPAGRCHSGTRKEVLQTILTWINDPSPPHPILWLRGLAGVGKSSIAQTISETLSREYTERYAGSFFFRNGVIQGEKLFPTLAYQIGVHRIDVRDILEEVMNQNHSLPTKTMDIQMKSLIIDPLRRASIESPLHHTPTIIIDGLDECQGSDLQCQILSLIAESLNLHRVPIRFLISSRPEYWIREAFEQEMLSSLTSQLSLDAPHLDSYDDIEQYLHDGFEQIYKKKARYMSNVEQPWPPPQVIQNLAYHASGQFIYASTVLKFVGSASDYCDPRKQLEIITRPGRLHATVFSDLDKLYTRILSIFPQLDVLKAVLGSLLMRANPYVIQKFLGLDSGEISLALDSLSSLTITYKENYHPEDHDLAKIYAPPEFVTHFLFAHRSFEDFISDETRSGAFSINTDAFCEKLAFVFFSNLKGTLNGATDFEENYDVAYRSIYFAIRDLPTLQSSIADLQPQILHFLSSTNRSIQHPTTLLRFFECIQLLLRQSTISQHSICPVIRTLLEEKCYPKMVRHMISSGELAISDILIYMTGPTHIRLNFITDMPGNNFARTKTFLCGAKGITSFELHQYAHPVDEEIYFSSFKLLDSIQSVLDGGGEELHCVAYRAQCILACFQSWKIIDNHSTYSGHLRYRIARFFHNHRLSDIQDEQDLSIPSFIPLIRTIVNHNWGRSPYRDWQDLAIVLVQWSDRQCNRGDIMNVLEGLDAVLAGKIRNFPMHIYETFSLPDINQLPSHIRETWVCQNRNGRGLSLRVIPPSDGSLAHIYTEEEVVFQDFAVQRWITILDVRFLDVMQSIPDDCRPHYANQVVEIRLNSVVKDLYRTLHPGALTSGVSQMTFQERNSSYLSYLQPTIAILNALRVICYLGSEIISSRQSSESMVTSLPTSKSDLGNFAMCLVEKYEENDISPIERDWFKTCLENWGAVEGVERSRRSTSPTGLDIGEGKDVLFANDIKGKDNDY